MSSYSRDYGIASPLSDNFCIDLYMINDLLLPVPDTVHQLYTQHLILGLEMFDDVLSLGYLIYQQGTADESGTSQTFPYIRIWFSSLERSPFFLLIFK